jgi:GT2 family glycosyltransferase
MPSVSIIVPIFNGIRYLPAFFESLARAVPPSAELILVDDASTEPVLDALPSDYPVTSITKLKLAQNQGYSAAVNHGFTRARGDILIQLNTDLVLDLRCIDAMLHFIDRTPQVGIVGSKQLYPTTGLVRHIGMAFGHHSHRHVYAGLPADHPLCCKTRPMQIVSGATAAMARTLLNKIGPLDEDYYNTLENFDHCLKAHTRGYINYTCADSIVYHWVGQSGPARYARADEGEAYFWSRWASSRTIDLPRFVDEALDQLLDAHPRLSSYDFELMNLCRSSDERILRECLERRWPNCGLREHTTQAFNSPTTKLWLPMELPHWLMSNPSPYVYLVDRLSDLVENSMWFEARHRVVEDEIVLDARAGVLTSHELLAL